MKNPTITEAYEQLLKDLDDSYNKLRVFHADITHINSNTQAYKKSLEDFNYCMNALWRFKDVIGSLDII